MMRREYEIVIADTSCFILLDNIDELQILKSLFGYVVTTSIIALEFGSQLPEWIEIRTVKNILFQSTLDIDPGEASAIALAIESEPSLLILDDAKGRKVARKLNLNFTGTLGIFLKAKSSGIIPAIRPMLDKIQRTNFRYSQAVFKEILSLAGE
jgi:predicted nucleic acid-binding protein